MTENLVTATGHTIKAFLLMYVYNTDESLESINVKIPLPIKTFKRGGVLATLFLHFLKEDSLICSTSTFLHYLHITEKRDNI